MSGVALLSEEQIQAIVKNAVREALADAQAAPAVMSVPDAAKYARRSENTVRGWIASHALPAQRRGRVYAIRREDLDRYLAGDRRIDAVVPSVEEIRARMARRGVR